MPKNIVVQACHAIDACSNRSLSGQRIVFAQTTRFACHSSGTDTMPNRRRPATKNAFFARGDGTLFQLIPILATDTRCATVNSRFVLFLVLPGHACLARSSQPRCRFAQSTFEATGAHQHFSYWTSSAQDCVVRRAIGSCRGRSSIVARTDVRFATALSGLILVFGGLAILARHE